MSHFVINTTLLLSCLSMATIAQADCTLLNNAKAGNVSVPLMASYALDPGSAANTILDNQALTMTSSAAAMGLANNASILSCSAGESLIWGNSAFAMTSINGTGYLKSGIENVYFRLYTRRGSTSSLLFPTTSGANFSRIVSTINHGAPRWMDIGEMVVVLETNGRVSQGGVVPGGLLARWSLSDGKTLLDINIAPFTVNVLGCTVTTPTLSVPLGAVNRARFRGLGSTAGGSKFSIGMTCDSAISPTVTFSGTPDNDASNILALNSISDGTAASGVGIQLLYKDNPVLLNSAISLGKTTSAGGLNMDFNARYYQTTPSITAGEANSTASFTINYE